MIIFQVYFIISGLKHCFERLISHRNITEGFLNFDLEILGKCIHFSLGRVKL